MRPMQQSQQLASEEQASAIERTAAVTNAGTAEALASSVIAEETRLLLLQRMDLLRID